LPKTKANKVAVLCAEEEAEELRSKFSRFKNADFIPAITFADDEKAAADAVSMAEEAPYVIFGSKHSVRLFFKAAKSMKKKDPLKNAQTFAAGTSTAKELEHNGVKVSYAPETGGLLEVYIRIEGMEHGPVLEISGAGPGKKSSRSFAPGFMYIRAIIYSVNCLKLEFKAKDYSAILFPSSMEVESLFKSLDYDFESLAGIKAICIGRKALRKAKEAFPHTEAAKINSMKEAIVAAGGVYE